MINLAQTAQRHDNLRRLITELQQADLTQDEMADLFGCSRSGVRAYLKCLDALVEVICRASVIVPRTYRITRDQAAIDAFLASLVIPEKPAKPKRIRSRMGRALADPARHIHVAGYDAPYRVPTPKGTPVHPPVHAAFWAGRTA